MPGSVDQLTLEFLTWLAARPRTYAEAMDGWRTSCPRLTIWEDAIRGGFIQCANGPTQQESLVMLTQRGRQLIEARPAEK